MKLLRDQKGTLQKITSRARQESEVRERKSAENWFKYKRLTQSTFFILFLQWKRRKNQAKKNLQSLLIAFIELYSRIEQNQNVQQQPSTYEY